MCLTNNILVKTHVTIYPALEQRDEETLNQEFLLLKSATAAVIAHW